LATWLFVTGGSGGLLAAGIAAEAGLAGFLAFPLSPVFSAFGLSQLDLLHVYEARPDASVAALEALAERARRDMRGEGADVAALSFVLEAEIGGEGGVAAHDCGDASDLAAAAARAQALGPGVRLLRLKASVPARRGTLAPRPPGPAKASGTRAVVWNGTATATPVYDWDGLGAGATFAGPALIESADTTVPIPPGASARVGRLGEIRVPRAS
jgi:N-methylhydantoinase A